MTTPVGSLATEAALLLDAVAVRLHALRPDGPGPGPAGAAGPGAGGTDPDGTGSDPAPSTGTPPEGTRTPSGVAPGVVCPECGHDPTAAVTCTACPLCRFLAVVRGERPETTARLVDGALTVVQALRALLPDPSEPSDRRTRTDGPTVDRSAGRTDKDPDNRADGGQDGQPEGGQPGSTDTEGDAGPTGRSGRPRPIATAPSPPGRPAGGLERIDVR